MSTVQDLTFHENENWKIEFVAHDVNGDVQPLPSGCELDLMIEDAAGTELLHYMIGAGVTVVDWEAGAAEMVINVAEQTSKGLVPPGPYFYEIRLVIGDDVSIQAEGQWLIQRSLFASASDAQLEQFKIRFPEFEKNGVSDMVISMALSDAALVVDGDDSWSPTVAPIAKLFLAAHLLQMRKNAALQYEGGAITAGQVRSIRVEDRMIAFGAGNAASSAVLQTGLQQTMYGQEYLAMLRKRTNWLLRA